MMPVRRLDRNSIVLSLLRGFRTGTLVCNTVCTSDLPDVCGRRSKHKAFVICPTAARTIAGTFVQDASEKEDLLESEL